MQPNSPLWPEEIPGLVPILENGSGQIDGNDMTSPHEGYVPDYFWRITPESPLFNGIEQIPSEMDGLSFDDSWQSFLNDEDIDMNIYV